MFPGSCLRQRKNWKRRRIRNWEKIHKFTKFPKVHTQRVSTVNDSSSFMVVWMVTLVVKLMEGWIIVSQIEEKAGDSRNRYESL